MRLRVWVMVLLPGVIVMLTACGSGGDRDIAEATSSGPQPSTTASAPPEFGPTPRPPVIASPSETATASADSPSTPAPPTPEPPEATMEPVATFVPIDFADPINLVIQPQDLPEELLIAATDDTIPGEYSIVYFNPVAPTEAVEAAGKMVGVVANVSLHDDPTQAQRVFIQQGSLSAGAVIDEIAENGAVSVSAEELAARISGVDRQLVFRVAYTLNGAQLHEYRYRFIVGTAVANLVITGRAEASGGEPINLRTDSLSIVKKQVERLANRPN